MTRQEIKQQAKSLVKGNLWLLFKPMLIIMGITMIISLIPGLLRIQTTTTETVELFGKMIEVESNNLVGEIWSTIVTAIELVLSAGLVNYVLKFIKGETPEINDIFSIIKKHWWIILEVSIIVSLLTTLGTLLLIIPGIIISLGLSLCNYIIVDNSELSAMEVIKKSWAMMKGHKGEYLVYELSFLGWILLCIFIFPVYYVIPYMNVTFALFYEQLRKNEIQE